MSLGTRVLAVDHRVPLLGELARRSLPRSAAVEFKRRVTEAYLLARSRSPVIAQHGALILDHELGGEGIRLARQHGVSVGQPIEAPGVVPLALYPEFEELLRTRPAFAKCLVSGRPDDSAETFEQQNRTVEQLFHACERHGVPLVLELIVPRRPEEDARRFEGMPRAELTARWMRHLSSRGVRPAHWKLEGLSSAEAAQHVAGACGPGEEIVILGKSASPEQLEAWFRAARSSPRWVGFAVGRSIFWEPFLLHLGGASSDRVVREMADRYLRVVELWETAG